MDTRGIGRRIAYWRGRRNLTQTDFGALMGQSRRWVQDLEGGQRQQDPRLSVVERAAQVLRVPLELLLSDVAVGGGACADAEEIEAIREVLQRHDVITGTCADDGREPLTVEVLRRNLAYGRAAFQSGHFASLGRLVPELLADANLAAARYEGNEQLAAYGVLSLTLELAEAVAVKYGDGALAWLAGHQAVAAAERSGAPVIMASAARHLVDAMTHHGQARAAAAFAVAAADRLEAELLVRGSDGLSVLGMLYLKAAMALAAAGESADRDSASAAAAVPSLLDQAEEHAEQLGNDGNAVWTAFGPTNVRLYRVAAHVRLSQGAEAVAVAQGIPDPARAALPRERRAHHLADLARGYTQAGLREEAVNTLLEAEQEAPEEVRCRPHSHALVEDLRLLGAGAAEGRLRALAGRCGLPG
ncbi:helix-turn-helix domain-containing protein [Streptomyces roseoverticillatus]|uniref:helix-turn-helix domain-containing protein n=1 Tax=Streptomyces roseoverticillatus TaxID=66429 RepID=UPI0004C10618|nr:helix-turn-helix transcriptional regulator [Streptomyces roseoverticillatus]